MIVRGASIEVVTLSVVGVVVTAQVSIAEVIGTDIAVVARLGLTGNAATHHTAMPLRALVSVLAGVVVDLVRTAGQGNAEVIGTWVVVVAILWGRSHATTTRAHILESTGVQIVARL